MSKLHTVLVANRGEIACRVIRTLKKMGIKSVAVYSEADAQSEHATSADVAVCVGPAPAGESYLNAEKILAVAKETGAQAIHPGYGFLSENTAFAEAAEKAGIAFIGPTSEQIQKFGLKHTARELAAEAKVPLLPGTGILASLDDAKTQATRIGYPVMLKSTAGGGGIGLRMCANEAELAAAYESVQRLGESHFKNAGAFLEKYVSRARHVEVQIFGDGAGKVVAIGERDCSVQRRNQKVIEETPAPNLPESVRSALHSSAVRLMESVSYRSAGTVEYIVDAASGEFYFLEVNTRLQVEHGVTELVFGVDLVEWMILCAAGEPVPFGTLPAKPKGHAIQARVYAEDPAKTFQPSAGLLTSVKFPEKVRVDGWVETGTAVTAYYDPLLAKVMVWGESRPAAVKRLAAALAETEIAGIETNLAYLKQVIATSQFSTAAVTTQFLPTVEYRSDGIDVLSPGTQTTVQDYPGRLGYWAVGLPPSGPMDSLSFRLANRVVGNATSAAALELTMTGPTLRFRGDATIAIVGADMSPKLDGKAVPLFEPIAVRAGQTLAMSGVTGPGARTYLAVRGGFAVPEYLGSRATFTLGGFGGHGGRALRVGDVLHVAPAPAPGPKNADAPRPLPDDLVPVYQSHWDIGVLEGPHAAPDFFAEEFIASFYDVKWKVHYNSARTGVRLIGPKPTWTRTDGGEAGLHPSNIHDNAYAVGAIDFTGDMPIILGPDGPSLGGFVCPVTIVSAELWKIGQLKPGDTVRFRPWAPGDAEAALRSQIRQIEALEGEMRVTPVATRTQAVLRETRESAKRVRVTYRRAGDKYLLVEYGPMALDLSLRLRVHLLMQWLESRALKGIVDLTPGIRSLQIHYDNLELPLARLLDVLAEAESSLPKGDAEVPSRVVHLPLSWDDPATQLAIQKYTQSVRPDAPWAPSNIEFIRRINGLASEEDVKKIVFGASYLVMGLGDVYLGAPVATPVDPRHRLVTTKYNPARTWTPENAVGIGGAYLCVYGMEGPGGYQFVGRTVQMYNRFKRTKSFAEKPWLLQFFDRIRFYPVSAKELLELREAFVAGRFDVDVQPGTFSFGEYRAMLESEKDSIAAFKTAQQQAFDEERERWVKAGLLQYSSDEASEDAGANGKTELPAGATAVESHVSGSVWKVKVEKGAKFEQGAPLVIVESMKMEVTVEAPFAGTVVDVVCREGKPVNAGQTLVVVQAEA